MLPVDVNALKVKLNALSVFQERSLTSPTIKKHKRELEEKITAPPPPSPRREDDPLFETASLFPVTLDILPRNALNEIALHLDVKDLNHLSKTSKRMREVFRKKNFSPEVREKAVKARADRIANNALQSLFFHMSESAQNILSEVARNYSVDDDKQNSFISKVARYKEIQDILKTAKDLSAKEREAFSEQAAFDREANELFQKVTRLPDLRSQPMGNHIHGASYNKFITEIGDGLNKGLIGASQLIKNITAENWNSLDNVKKYLVHEFFNAGREAATFMGERFGELITLRPTQVWTTKIALNAGGEAARFVKEHFSEWKELIPAQMQEKIVELNAPEPAA